MDEITTRTTGFGAVLQRANSIKAIRPIRVSIGTQDTSGGVLRRKKGSDKRLPTRSAGLNMIILRKNARVGRKVNFTSVAERREIDKLWVKATEKLVDGKKALDIAARVGQKFIANLRSHIKQRRSETGRVRDVTKATQARKDREGARPSFYGLSELPPLIRTGQLYRSFILHVREL